MKIRPLVPPGFSAWLDAQEMGLPEECHDFGSLDQEAAARGLGRMPTGKGPAPAASGPRGRALHRKGRDYARLHH